MTAIARRAHPEARIGTQGDSAMETLPSPIKAAVGAPNFLIKVIPHVDGSARICELVEYRLEDFEVRGAPGGSGSLQLKPHALAPVADLPALKTISAVHFIADLTLRLGKTVHDYLQPRAARVTGRRLACLLNESCRHLPLRGGRFSLDTFFDRMPRCTPE
jgi:hypothetical protein